ncbi:hypothetical protein B5G54_03765, partial [Ralstonia solanacearum]
MSRQVQLNKIVGRLIAKKREALNLTQEEMAHRMNLGTEGYARLERGITPVTVSRLVKLADIFQCGVAELVVETSTGITAQAQHIANLMEGLSTSDRDEVLSIVEKVCTIAHKGNADLSVSAVIADAAEAVVAGSSRNGAIVMKRQMSFAEAESAGKKRV